MGAEEGRRLAAFLVGIVGETLPERQRLPRVVAGPRHIQQPQVVRLQLLGTGVGQDDPHRGADAVGGEHQLLGELGVLVQGLGQGQAAHLHQQLLGQALRTVAGHGVGHLVTDDRGHTGLVLRDVQDPRIHPHLAAGQTKGIGRVRFVEDHELPVGIGQVHHRGDVAADPIDHGVDLRVVGDGDLPFHLLELSLAHGGGLTGADQHDLTASGPGDGSAAGESAQAGGQQAEADK